MKKQSLEALGRSRLAQASGTVYAGSDRRTVLDHTNKVRQILSPALPLTAEQRAAGNYLGHCVESIGSIGSGDITMERVDGGGHGTDDRMVQYMATGEALRVARTALMGLPTVTYRASKGAAGRHRPVKPERLVMAVCVEGMSVTEVGIRAEWVTSRIVRKKKGSQWIETEQLVVPDRQRKALTAALSDALQAIAEAWESNHCPIPNAFYAVKVR